MQHIVLTVHIILCIFIVFFVMIQRTDSDGMGGISGGGNMNSFLTGRAAANALTRTTSILAALFFCTSIGLAYLSSSSSSKSILDNAPAAATTPAAQSPDATSATEQKVPVTPAAPSVPMAQ